MHDFSFVSSPFMPGMTGVFLPLLALAALWTIILKGYALWHSARAGQKWWFIALLIVNTLGILEIIYLIWFRPGAPHAHTSPSTPTKPVTPEHDSSGQA